MTEAEVETISTKYESFRLRDKRREKYLLQSILQYGIRQPLQCVQGDGVQNYILLDGFKRLAVFVQASITMSSSSDISSSLDSALTLPRVVGFSKSVASLMLLRVSNKVSIQHLIINFNFYLSPNNCS